MRHTVKQWLKLTHYNTRSSKLKKIKLKIPEPKIYSKPFNKIKCLCIGTSRKSSLFLSLKNSEHTVYDSFMSSNHDCRKWIIIFFFLLLHISILWTSFFSDHPMRVQDTLGSESEQKTNGRRKRHGSADLGAISLDLQPIRRVRKATEREKKQEWVDENECGEKNEQERCQQTVLEVVRSKYYLQRGKKE